MVSQDKYLSVACVCGKVSFQAVGSPILAAACYCTSCRKAGQAFEALPSAPRLLDGEGGTSVILYRKDRVRCVSGVEHLAERTLKPESPTRRVLATCCNSPMFLDFTKGHWVSLYRNRFVAGGRAPEMRIMTKDRRAGMALRDDLPNYEGYPRKFLFKLIAAWIAMGFSKPDMGLQDIPRSTFGSDNPSE